VPPFHPEAVIDASPNAVIAVDANGRFSYANPRVESTFGYSPDEILGEPVEILLPSALRFVTKPVTSSELLEAINEVRGSEATASRTQTAAGGRSISPEGERGG
jgi:PAS domain S-box-containing protein